MDDDDGLVFTAIAALITLGASAVARKVLAKGWSAKRGTVPDPNDANTGWGEAAAFALASGAAVGLARLFADRGLGLFKEKRKGTANA